KPGSPEAALPFEFAWFPQRLVTARFVGPDGASIEARAVLIAQEEAKFDDVAPAREVSLEAPAEAGLRLVVEPADPHLRRRVIALPAPAAPSRSSGSPEDVALGDIHF